MDVVRHGHEGTEPGFIESAVRKQASSHDVRDLWVGESVDEVQAGCGDEGCVSRFHDVPVVRIAVSRHSSSFNAEGPASFVRLGRDPQPCEG